MTEKEIIRAEIERRKSLADKQKNNGYFSARSDAYAELLNFIDSIQEDLQVRKYRCLRDYCPLNEPRSYTYGKIYDVYRDDQGCEWITNDNGHTELFGYICEHFELVKKLEPKFMTGDTIRRKDDGLKATVVCVSPEGYAEVVCEDKKMVILNDEWELSEISTSNDLKAIIDKEANTLWKEVNTGHNYSIIDSFNQFYGMCLQIAEDGAQWQKQKSLKWLSDNHKEIFNNGWAEGFEDGRDSMEDDMEKDAIPARVLINKYGNKYLQGMSGLVQYDTLKVGDRVRIYIFKED